MTSPAASSRCNLFLFGSPRIELKGKKASTDRRKAVALLAYLALTRTPQTREALAAFFWPEHDGPHASAYLRRTLWEINQMVGPGRMLADRESVELVRDAGLWVDADEFRRLVAAAREKARSNPASAAVLDSLLRAAELAQDDLLAGLGLKDAPAFEEWLFFEREGLRRDLAGVLDMLAAGYAAQGRAEEAIPFARRRLSLDPLDEAAHRSLMRIYEQAGQHAAALRQYQECERILRSEVGGEPDTETARLYQELRAGRADPLATRAGRPAAQGAAEPRPNNLPIPPTPFVGRESELDKIVSLLGSPDCRLLSLIGPGGAGKSRLALQAARKASPAFSNGVYWVSLAPLTDPRLVVSAIADAIGFAFFGSTTGPDDPMQKRQLLEYLSGKELLLVLDNFEHLMGAAVLPSDILQAAPQVKILVTSRQRLNVQEEWALRVEGMSVPEIDARGRLDEYGAVQLFTACLRRLAGDVEIDETDRPYIIRICRAVDGLPLGLELAAAWARTLSLADMAAEIESNLDVLTSSARNMPERHSSLRAVFDSSWKLLSPAEQKTFARLSVFHGGFTREAAAAVAGATLPLLTALVDQSMLYRGPGGRYALHEVLLQFGREKLEGQGKVQHETRQRHAEYFAERATTWNRQLRGREQLAALDAMTVEIENIRAAFLWAVRERRAELVLSFVMPLAFFCDYRSRFQEGEALFGQAAAEWEAAAPETTEDRIVQAALVSWHGWFCGRVGRIKLGQERAAEALAALEGIGWEAGDVKCMVNMCNLSLMDSYQDQSPRLLEEARIYYESRGDRWGIARLVPFAVWLAWDSGHPEESERLYLEGLEIVQELGDARVEMELRNQLGDLYHPMGRLEEARRQYEASLAIARALGDRWATHLALDSLGFLTRRLGGFDEARGYLLESLDIAREIGDRLGIAGAVDNLGLVAFDLGRYDEAERLFEEGLAERRRCGQIGSIVFSLFHLAQLAHARGQDGRAEEIIREIQERFPRDAGPDPYRNYNLLGDIALSRGQVDAARQEYAYALEAARRVGNMHVQLESLIGLAACAPAAEAGRAVERLAFVEQHPASDYMTRRRARQQLTEKAVGLLPDACEEAIARGRSLTLQAALEGWVQPREPRAE